MSINEDMELSQGTEEVLPLKSKRAHMFSVVPDAVAEPVTVEEKKGLPRNSSSEPLISADEMSEIEVEKSKLSKRKLKKSGRMTVEVKPIVCENSTFKGSSNVIFVQCHLCFKHNYSQVKRGVEKPERKLPFIQRFSVMRRRPTMRKRVRLKSRMSDIDSQKYQKSILNGERPFMEIYIQEKSTKEKPLSFTPTLRWTAVT
ncbi:uncharacterized protein TNIN_450901 [Trichonephila inaurata madagascariensis]|uniref:Uncharacterized protein n=1 Tax=Trichonephila inaurata madagascariensis TaxID=2747483 RepID=A0A8X6YIA2_9ARAC|nr:uncharacterized protein TNIN_450901 [Trichonephila inaurata madagascariensis]